MKISFLLLAIVALNQLTSGLVAETDKNAARNVLSDSDVKFYEPQTFDYEPEQIDNYQAVISAVDLDLLDHDPELLAEKEAEYKADLTKYIQMKMAKRAESEEQDIVKLNSRDKIVDYTTEKDNDQSINYSEITKYKMKNRSSFNEKQFKYIVAKNPKSVVMFEDTNTIMVPDKESVLDQSYESLNERLESDGEFIYYEVALAKSEMFVNEAIFPVSGCLKFPTGKGSGSVSFSYSSEINLNYYMEFSPNHGITPYVSDVINVGVSLSFTSNSLATQSISISGTHTCNTDNGDGVRLFYSPTAVQVVPRTRNMVFTVGKNIMFVTEWEQLKKMNYMTNSNPIYYCATEDKVDLKCGSDEKLFVDSENVTYNHNLKSSSVDFNFI